MRILLFFLISFNVFSGDTYSCGYGYGYNYSYTYSYGCDFGNGGRNPLPPRKFEDTVPNYSRMELIYTSEELEKNEEVDPF